MDINSLVNRMMRAARNDYVNGKGRIVISDFLESLYQSNFEPEQNLPKPDEMITAWKLIHPNQSIRQPSKNILIIDLGRHGPSIQQPFKVKEGEELVRE